MDPIDLTELNVGVLKICGFLKMGVLRWYYLNGTLIPQEVWLRTVVQSLIAT